MFDWIKQQKQGLFCEPGQFYIDPCKPVDRAVITHGHADHARAGHRQVLATPATHAIMHLRLGSQYAVHKQPVDYQEVVRLGEVEVSLLPAGHILGSAQVLLEYQGQKVIVSGDYKRRYDPTCLAFQPHACDLFITEATFGLPIFRHPPIAHELDKLVNSLAEFPWRCHAVGVYALGKAQRLICSLRQYGYSKPIYLHTSLLKLCELYQHFGCKMEGLIDISQVNPASLAGELVLATPGIINSSWVNDLPSPLLAMASGWMQIKARSNRVELPLIISDHADWNELNHTITELKPREVWVTHGDERALVYACRQQGIHARSLTQS